MRDLGQVAEKVYDYMETEEKGQRKRKKEKQQGRNLKRVLPIVVRESRDERQKRTSRHAAKRESTGPNSAPRSRSQEGGSRTSQVLGLIGSSIGHTIHRAQGR